MTLLLAASILTATSRIDFPPTPLSRLLPALGTKIGTPLACSGSLKNRVLMIVEEGASNDELLKRIAEAAGGEWDKSDSGAVLRRPQALEKRDKENALRLRTAAIKKKIDAMAAEVEKTPRFDMPMATRYLDQLAQHDAKQGDPMSPDYVPDFEGTIFNQGPAGRATIRLLKMVDPAQLASLHRGQITFSTEPNRYEIGLPQATTEVVRKLIDEEEVWHRALDSTNRKPRAWIGGDPRMDAPVQGEPSRTLLNISTNSPISPFTVELYVVGSDGQTMLHSRVIVNAGFFTFGNTADDQNFKKNPDFTFSPMAQQFQRAVGLMDRKNQPLTAELEDRLLNPQKWDPVSFGTQEVFREAATRNHENLIAAIPDRALGAELDVPASINLDAYLRYVVGRMGLSIESKDGWLCVGSDPKLGPAPDNIDREAVHSYCIEIHRTGMLSLDNAASILLAMPNGDWDPVSFSYTAALVPRLERLLQFQNAQLLKIYGLLSPQQRKSLRSGESVAYSSMPQAARATIEDLLLNSADDPTDGITKDGSPERSAYPPIDSLPRELLGRGLPSDGSIRCKPGTDRIAVVGTMGGHRYTPWTTVIKESELSSFLGASIASEPNDKQSQIWYGRQIELTLYLPLMDGYGYEGRLKEVQANLLAKPLTYSDLPAETQKAIDMAGRARNADQSAGGNGKVPPPDR